MFAPGSPFSYAWPVAVEVLLVLLLLHLSRGTGTRRDGGYLRRYAFTSMRERGTQTPETAITAECSSRLPRGVVLAVRLVPIGPRRVSSCTALGYATSVTEKCGGSATADHGATVPELAGSDE